MNFLNCAVNFVANKRTLKLIGIGAGAVATYKIYDLVRPPRNPMANPFITEVQNSVSLQLPLTYEDSTINKTILTKTLRVNSKGNYNLDVDDRELSHLYELFELNEEILTREKQEYDEHLYEQKIPRDIDIGALDMNEWVRWVMPDPGQAAKLLNLPGETTEEACINEEEIVRFAADFGDIPDHGDGGWRHPVVEEAITAVEREKEAVVFEEGDLPLPNFDDIPTDAEEYWRPYVGDLEGSELEHKFKSAVSMTTNARIKFLSMRKLRLLNQIRLREEEKGITIRQKKAVWRAFDALYPGILSGQVSYMSRRSPTVSNMTLARYEIEYRVSGMWKRSVTVVAVVEYVNQAVTACRNSMTVDDRTINHAIRSTTGIDVTTDVLLELTWSSAYVAKIIAQEELKHTD